MTTTRATWSQADCACAGPARQIARAASRSLIIPRPYRVIAPCTAALWRRSRPACQCAPAHSPCAGDGDDRMKAWALFLLLLLAPNGALAQTPGLFDAA